MIPNLTNGYKDSANWVFIVQTIGLVSGTSLLSFLLYKISESMFESRVTTDVFED